MPVVVLSSSGSGAGRGSSENISFRLHKEQLDQLRQEAKEKRIGLNTLASHIIDSYLNFTSSASKAGAVPVSEQQL
jgi:predicted HicB family RNase H-like nuclease